MRPGPRSPRSSAGRRGARTATALLAAAAALATILATTALTEPTAGAATRYPVGNAADGYARLLADPAALPAGMNNWSCRPSAAHPRPVILLPGTLWTLLSSFDAMAPILANAGYCVYGLNYGATALAAQSGGRVYASGDIPASAAQLAAFVQHVRAATGSPQVDIVGWSQGGMMPRYYLEFLGGARYVHQLVGLASSNHGTTLDGMFRLVTATGRLVHIAPLTLIGCPACTQQENTSPFIAALNAGGDTVPGVGYTVIESRYDEVVTPYRTAFLSGANVRNITLQQQCPLDLAEHLAMPYDAVVIQDVLNALGADDPAFRPNCGLTLPVLGSP